MSLSRIPFDSLCVSAIAWELQDWVGCRVQHVFQNEESEVILELYKRGIGYLRVCTHADFYNVGFVTKRPKQVGQVGQWGQALRTHLVGKSIVSVEQLGFDRKLKMQFEGHETQLNLMIELIGTHSNAILTTMDHRVVAASRYVAPTSNKKGVLLGKGYEPDQVIAKPSLLEVSSISDLEACKGVSPFLKRLIGQSPERLIETQSAIESGKWLPVVAPGFGSYPVSVDTLGYSQHPRASYSIALEQSQQAFRSSLSLERAKLGLSGEIRQALKGRRRALQELEVALAASEKVGYWQDMGALILTYQGMIQPAAEKVTVWDREGKEVVLTLNKELTATENAEAYFLKAKKAKARKGEVEDQFNRISAVVSEMEYALEKVESATLKDEVDALQQDAISRGWFRLQVQVAKKKEERPFEGNRVRQLLGPGGYQILYGETSEANDYLTTRVAKGNDIWLHLRGQTSAHVVIQTLGKPEKVQREVLMFAAEIAVRNSPAKHSNYVAVDYTLKKYVRKPRGAPKGSVLYTHEKTLHVN